MRVKPVTSPNCEVCKMYKHDTDVLADLRLTIEGIRDVHWEHKEIELVDSVEVDRDPWPTLSRKNGKISANTVFTSPIDTLEKYADAAGEELFTPSIFLISGEYYDPDFVEMIDLTQYNEKVLDIPWSVTRSCMSTIFGFYLRHDLGLPRTETEALWQEQTAKSPTALEPPYDYGNFQTYEWQQAFRRARQVEPVEV